MAVLDSGSCSVPYAEHCGGQYELWTPSNAEDSDELRAGFVIECAAKADAPPSRLSFDGLYDGERIAGTVHDDKAGGEVIADFLCTRLFPQAQFLEPPLEQRPPGWRTRSRRLVLPLEPLESLRPPRRPRGLRG